MRVLVVGAGAIGSILGGFLTKAGHVITLFGRAWHLDVIRKDGLIIDGIWGEHHFKDLHLYTDPESLSSQAPYDWIFVCVKAHQTGTVAKLVKRFSGSESYVCAFQNGLGNYEALIEHLPSNRVALGRIIFGAEIQPGCVHVSVCADQITIGAVDESFPSDKVDELVDAFTKVEIPCRRSTAILTDVWAKVLYNCALNGLSTLLEVPYGKLLEHKMAPSLMQHIVEEAYEVAKGQDIKLEPATAKEYIDYLFKTLIPLTAAHHSSMLQDLNRGKSTEIDAINGAIVRLAKQVNIETPVNALVTRLVHTKEQFINPNSSDRP